MKVKKLLSVVLSMVVVASCTLLCASAATKSEPYADGSISACAENKKSYASTRYLPATYYLKRSVSATLYYKDVTGAMRNVSDSQTVYVDNPEARVSFWSYSNVYSITSTHTIGHMTKTLSVYA